MQASKPPPKRDAVALAVESVTQTYDFKPLSERTEKLLSTWEDSE